MKNRCSTLIILFLFSLVIVSCVTFGQAEDWLNEKRGNPKINITGAWDAGSVFGGGWGEANIVQTGNKIIGAIGLYSITGAVNADNIYLVFTSGSKIYYTASLKPSEEGMLAGIVVEGAIVDTDRAEGATKHPIILKKYGKVK